MIRANVPGIDVSTLTVVVLLDTTDVPAWQHHLLQQLAATDFISAQILVCPDRADHPQPGALYRAVRRYEARRTELDADACEPRSVLDLCDTAAAGPCPEPLALESLENFDALLRHVAENKPDVIVALSHLRSIAALSALAHFGAWYFAHGCGQTEMADGSTVGLWNVLKGHPYLRSELLARKPGSTDATVASVTYSPVHSDSHTRTRNEHLWKTLFLLPRALGRLQVDGAETFFGGAQVVGADSETVTPDIGRWRLGNANLLFPVALYAARRLWQKIERKFIDERWTLMVSRSADPLDMQDFELISPPAGRFWADPLALRRDDTDYVFFEDACVDTGHGCISVIRSEPDGRCSEATRVLSKPYHLSYPYVFEWSGDTYMVPESADNRTIELYRCIEFPAQWEFVHNLMENVSAYDATIFEFDGRWWMFANVQAHPGTSTWDELCLFHADSPVSQEWMPHPRNPVISDVRTARPAGRVFSRNGEMYRPSQDSSYRYGYGLNINRIVELSPTEYREDLEQTVDPGWDRSIRAIHTLNFDDHLAVIDVVHRSRR